MLRRAAALFALPLTAAFLNACSVTPYSSLNPQGQPLIIGSELHHVDRDYITRYMCAGNAVLQCTCVSRLSRDCLCQCAEKSTLGFGFTR